MNVIKSVIHVVFPSLTDLNREYINEIVQHQLYGRWVEIIYL